jgi:hypothetical protein
MELPLAQFALVVYGGVFAITVVTTGMVTVLLFRANAEKAVALFGLFYDSGNGLRIITVLTTLATAAVLAFVDHLDAGLMSLLSGIAGFVLGGMKMREGAKIAELVRHETDPARLQSQA